MNVDFTVIFTVVLSSIATGVSIASFILWFREAENLNKIKTKFEVFEREHEALMNNNRRCMICKDRRDKI